MNIRLRFLLLAIMVAGWLAAPQLKGGATLTLSFLDVGQGDAILITSPEGVRILIDGGPGQTVVHQLDQAVPWWQRRVDVVMATHPDDDHISGLVAVMRRFKVGAYAGIPVEKQSPSYLALQSELRSQSIPEFDFFAGDRMCWYKLCLESYWPVADQDWQRVRGANDNSQVIRLTYGYFSALLTGDIDTKVWQMMSRQQEISPAEVLKLPHHGSKHGLSATMLQKVSPVVAVGSMGLDNRYGHPAVEVLDLLQQFEVPLYRTDLRGEVRVVVDGAGFSVYTER